jgi:photosystem II stability/assembly factor-like uncharacterized protein
MSTQPSSTTAAEPVAATWTHLASLHGGTVAALAASPTWAEDHTFFATTMAGLFRSTDDGRTWMRAAEGFTGLSLAGLAVSPMWSDDHTVLAASIDGNIFRIVFGGEDAHWTTANLRGRQVSVAALAISPAFNQDGMAFAATIGDGVLRTRDRGLTWDAWNFGLLDLEVLALAISPRFAEDETIFAATASGIFRSPNAGRAWRELQFPEDAGAVLCLAVSPAFGADQTLFAGTEEGGIYRSTDGGRRWKALPSNFDGEFLNALLLSPQFGTDHTLFAVTEAAVYRSTDNGQHWTRAARTPGAMSMALPPTYAPDAGDVAVVVGLAQEGVLRASGAMDDFAASNTGLAGRLLVGIAASTTAQGLVATWGPSEGVFVSIDGGTTWDDRTASLPSLEVNDVLIGAGTDTAMFAALPDGIFGWSSEGQWNALAEVPAHQLRASPAYERDGTLWAATRDQALWTSTDRGATWNAVPGFEPAQEILAVAPSPRYAEDQTVLVAARQPDGGVALVRGMDGAWTTLATHPDAARGALLTSAGAGATVEWYAALDALVYGPLGNDDIPVGPINEEQPRIVALATHGDHIFAATEAGLFVSADRAATWRPVDGDAARSLVAVAVSSDAEGATVLHALQLGGDIWRARLDN